MGDTVLSNFTPGIKDERTYAKKLRVGIIGTGWIAEAHAESYLHMPDVEVVALADLIPGKAEKFKQHYGFDSARCYGRHTELLAAEKELDAVSICTYNMQHAVCAIDCLNAGVNVLLEKPMTVTVEEAADIMRAEKKSGKLLSIGFQPRMDANMQMIKRSSIRARWAKSIISRRAAAAAAASPTAPLSSKRRRASARWATSAATRWTWF